MFLASASLSIKSFDPLEQFAYLQFFRCNFEEVHLMKHFPGKCPFNAIQISYNFYYLVSYIWEVAYFRFCYYFLNYVPTFAYFLLVWLIIVSIIFMVLVWDTAMDTLTFEDLRARSLQVPSSVLKFVSINLIALPASVVRANTSLARNSYFSIFCCLFFVILIANVSGLIPYTFTITSSFIVTFFLAATHFIGLNIIAVYKKQWTLANIFLPSGVPLVIAPGLVVIEIISYIAKVLSLSIRLFANMMSGHALLKILIGFSWTLLAFGTPAFITLGLFPWVLVTIIMFLEALIAFLQAYVFLILITIYLNDSITNH